MNGARQVSIAAVAVAIGCLAALPAKAAYFDFEDGTLQGWLTSTTGGSGSTTAELHNGSMMAYVLHTGAGTHYLSHDFTYVATDRLAFDMHAVSVPSGRGDAAASGVTVSFLNAVNVSVGSVGLYNTTNPGGLGAHSFAVDNLPHNYDNPMSTWADLAGIAPATPISKISVSFVSSANTSFFGDVSVAKVWADNILVGVVPEPSERVLLLAGLGVLALVVAKRQRIGSD
jgi:hypothetical protein